MIGIALPVLHRYQRANGLADEFLPRVARDDFHLGVDEQDQAPVIHREHPGRRGIDDQSEQFLGA